jgi:flagellar biosynthesis anti-sigma factor FlgM
MRIDPNVSASAIKRYENNSRHQAQSSDSRLSTQSDRVELSKQGIEYANMLKEAQQSDEFNAEKVNAIREQIRTGQYRPNAEVISQRMVEHIGLDAIV